VRLRAWFVAVAIATIVVGLVIHFAGTALSPRVRDFLGDALWAMMMVWWVSALLPGARLIARATTALAISWAVEFSQIYQTPTLDALRDTTLGRLVLGSGFDARDLIAYFVGVVAAVALETRIRQRRNALPIL
jgi:hypothetical protein